MFTWLSRALQSLKPSGSVSRDPVADAVFSVDSLGRLPEDLLEGGPAAEPKPEYVEKATEPSEEEWAHEREARKEQEEAES
jgi:hypothetical protein